MPAGGELSGSDADARRRRVRATTASAFPDLRPAPVRVAPFYRRLRRPSRRQSPIKVLTNPVVQSATAIRWLLVSAMYRPSAPAQTPPGSRKAADGPRPSARPALPLPSQVVTARRPGSSRLTLLL